MLNPTLLYKKFAQQFWQKLVAAFYNAHSNAVDKGPLPRRRLKIRPLDYWFAGLVNRHRVKQRNCLVHLQLDFAEVVVPSTTRFFGSLSLFCVEMSDFFLLMWRGAIRVLHFVKGRLSTNKGPLTNKNML